MGCYLEDYRARVGAWAGRLSWRGETKRGVGTRGEVNETIGTGLGLTMLSSLILALLLIIGGIEKILGRLWKQNTVRVLCTRCGKNLKSGIKCEQCEVVLL